jgi:hypothetical protein
LRPLPGLQHLEGYKGVLEIRDGTRENWQASIAHTNLHKLNVRWLVHSWKTFGARMSHGQPRTHNTHHNSDLGEATTFPLIVYFVALQGATSKWLFVPRLPNGSPKIPTVGIPTTLEAHKLACKPSIAMSLKKSCSPHQEIFNGMSHIACTQGNQVDSRLLVVESQTFDLIPSLFFGHNLCFKCPNGQCKPIFNIYASIAFSNDIKNSSNRWVLTLAILFWRFGSPFGTPIPNMGVHLGVWGFIPSHFLALLGACDVIPGSFSSPATLQPLALVVSPRLGLRQIWNNTWKRHEQKDTRGICELEGSKGLLYYNGICFVCH